jgi:hypothetical protein
MHPDEDRQIGRPADLLLTDPQKFEVIDVFRVQADQKTPVHPGDADYPFEDDSNVSVLGFAEDKGGPPDERFRKQTPRLRGQANDGLKGNEYELSWQGTPPGRGPHFKVFP